jgi:DNA polymerase IV
VLVRQFGQAGREMSLHARGIDDRPVVAEHGTRSISQEVTFSQDVSRAAVLTDTLRSLSEGVALTLRQKDLCAGTIRLKLRWSDFTTLTRQVSLGQPTDQDGVIFDAALDLLHSAWGQDRPVRLIGVGATRLVQRAHQLSLWDTPSQKEHRLLDALDELRERFGEEVVRKGKVSKKGSGDGPDRRIKK